MLFRFSDVGVDAIDKGVDNLWPFRVIVGHFLDQIAAKP